MDLTQKKVFVDNIDVSADIRAQLLRASASLTDSRLSADVLVVKDVAAPGTRSLWIAILLGLPIVSLTYLARASGPAIQYPAAVDRKLTVCLTPAFQRLFPVLSDIVRRASAKPQSRWTVVPYVPARVGASWLVFAAPDEVKQRRVPHACSPSMFRHRLGKPIRMAMGVCGM